MRCCRPRARGGGRLFAWGVREGGGGAASRPLLFDVLNEGHAVAGSPVVSWQLCVLTPPPLLVWLVVAWFTGLSEEE